MNTYPPQLQLTGFDISSLPAWIKTRRGIAGRVKLCIGRPKRYAFLSVTAIRRRWELIDKASNNSKLF